MTAPAASEQAGTLVLRGGLVVYASDGVAALAGRPVAELVGRPFDEFVVPDQRAGARDRYERRMRGEPVPPDVELALVQPGGGRRLVEVHAARDGQDVLVHLRDLSLRDARRLRLDAVAELGASLQRELAEEAVHRRVREGLAALGLASALVRVEAERVVIEWTSAPQELAERFLAITGRSLDGYVGRPNAFSSSVVADGYTFSDDWGRDASGIVPPALSAALRAAVNAAGGTRAIGVRLDERGGGTRAIIVAGDWVRSDDGPAVRLFGAQFEAALAAARTVADLSRRNAQLAVLDRVAELAGDARDLPAFFARAAEVVAPVARFTGCAIFVPDEAAGALVRIYATGGTPALDRVSDRIPLASPLGDVLRERTARVVAVPFPGGDPAFMAAMRFRSLAWVPLLARSRAVGLLAAGFDEGPEVARDALELLSAVGAHCASAIESHGLLSDLRRRVAELTLLVDVARASAQLDPALLLDASLRRVADTVGADAAAAYLRDGERLVLASATGVDGEGIRPAADLEAGPGGPGAALRLLAPATGELATAFPGMAAGLGPCGPRAPAVAVPLLAKAEPLGVLVVARARGAPFSEGDAALLASIGMQLGLSVDAARLFADVRRRLADLEAVHAFALRVHANTAIDVPSLLGEGCRDVTRALTARAAAVLLASPDRRTLRVAGAAGLPRVAAEGAIDVSLDTLSAEVMRERAPRVSEDVTRDPRSTFHGRTDVPPLAMLAVPLASRADVRGVLCVADLAGRRFGAGDVALANALAGALGIGLENAELYADARRRVEELFLLNEVGRAVGASLELGDVLREAAAGARRLVRTSRAYVILHDPARGELSFGGGAGVDDPALRELRGPLSPGSVIAEVIREQRPATVEDAERSGAPPLHPGARCGRAFVAVPVVLRGEPLGVLVADEERGPRRFAEPDVERLTAVADRLAAAIENARLYLETRRRAEELGLLHEVGRSLVETLDIEQVLDAGVRNLARIVDAPDAYLILATADRQLQIRAVTGQRAEAGRRLVLRHDPPEDNLVARVIASREPLVVEDALADARVRQDLRAQVHGRAYLALPLVVRDRAIGAVVIVETRRPRLFTPAEVERGAAIANQLAVAVDNARLYEDLRSSYAELERAQQQLIQGERLAALGELAAVVAHEVRNPLGVIFNSLGSLRRLVRPRGDARMLFDIVEEEAERLNRIVGDLLDFARPSTPELRPEQLERVVEDAVGVALGQQASGIMLARELDPAVPPVTMDARLVRQAVLNVAVNAVQAMPRGGRITVRTRREGAAALLEIEDTGAGIPEEVRERIFEPFFTTKASGTGLGLAVVKRIVEGHGGTVSVRSAPGAGTVFALRFPLEGPAVENGPAMG